MKIKVSWTLVQDERIFKNVSVVSKFHKDVFWIDNTSWCFDSVKARTIRFEDFAQTPVKYTTFLPDTLEIRTPYYAIEFLRHHFLYETLGVRKPQSFF